MFVLKLFLRVWDLSNGQYGNDEVHIVCDQGDRARADE